jgi:hypothetical protein
MRSADSAEVRIRPYVKEAAQNMKSHLEKNGNRNRFNAPTQTELVNIPAKDFRNLTDVEKRRLINDSWSLL